MLKNKIRNVEYLKALDFYMDDNGICIKELVNDIVIYGGAKPHIRV